LFHGRKLLSLVLGFFLLKFDKKQETSSICSDPIGDNHGKSMYDEGKIRRKVLLVSTIRKSNTGANRVNSDKKREAWGRVIGSLTGEFKRSAHGESLSTIISRKRREER